MKVRSSQSWLANKRVAIVGGGPGGLTLARLLQMNGVDVRVYERDAHRSARVQGATLNLNEESGLRAVQAAGLMDAFRAAYRPGAEKMIFMDRQGEVLFEEAGGENLRQERPEIDRGPLRELLLDSLQADTVTWDRQFASLQLIDGATKIEFKNDQSALADLVVAADGANSKLRAYVTSRQPVYAGVTVVEGTVHDAAAAIPRLHQLLDGGKICALGDEKSLVVVAKGDGSVSFYTGHKTEESWSRASGIDFAETAQILAWFEREFLGWHEMWTELVAQASAFVPRPQYCAPLDQNWEALPNLTLIGDAAHVMPPYAGEGVNMAMLDALELAECLLDETFVDPRSAIAAYEAKMRVRTSAAAEVTMEFTRIFHSSEAIPRLLQFFKAPHEGVPGQ